MNSNAPVFHYHRSTDDEPRNFDGVSIFPTLCERWEPRERFEENAKMGGVICRACNDRDKRPGQYRIG